jgi:hypothetical protein
VITAAGNVVAKFLTGVTQQLPKVISKGAALIITFLTEIRKHVPDFVRAGAKLIIAVIDGVGNQLGNIIKAGTRLIRKFLDGIATAIPEVVDAGFRAIVKFLHGIANAIRENDDALINAGADILDALVDGVVKAAGRLGGPMRKAIEGLFGLLPHWAKKILGIHSPSTVFAEIGKNSILGLKAGLDGTHGLVTASAANIGDGVVGAFKDTFQIQSPSKVLKEIGKEVGHGFRDGLDGSADDIRNAFASLKDKIRGEMENTRNSIKEQNDKTKDLQKQYAEKLQEVYKLRAAKKPDAQAINSAMIEANQLAKAIDKSEKAVGKYKGVLASLKGANSSLTRGLQDEKVRLLGLSKDYNTVSVALDAAKQKLDEATRARDDALKSYTEQFSQLPDWDNLLASAMAEADMTYEELAEARRKKREEAEKKSRINQVELYKQALRDQIAATKKYQETLAQLRGLGLDDATYKKLLSQGLAGQDFASQLLATGKSGVDQINSLDAELFKTAGGIATDASTALYQAGVNAAQGLVDGLTSKKADLERAMNNLADTIVRRIKNQLGIRSPSTVFAEVGNNAAQGLAQGLTDSSKSVADAAAGVGDEAAKALSNSLAGISDKVGSEIDTDVTITPVLDLSQVKKDAKNMPDIGGVVPITAAASYGQAAAISGETARSTAAATATQQAVPAFSFNQYNTSPESLSDIEIYRQTNNLLSNVKRGLNLPQALYAG